MADKIWKPTIEEILDLKTQTETLYGPVFDNFKRDDQYYDLAFKELMKLPEEFASQGIVLPTARDMVDTCVDNTDIGNARVFVNRKGTSPDSEDEQEMMRKFYLGLINRTNVENAISPWRILAKHYWLYGLAVAKTVWDADRRPDKPEQKENESDESYAERLDNWRQVTGFSLPIVIQAVNPTNIMVDPYNEVPQFLFETHERSFYDIKGKYAGWSNPKSRATNEKAECISFWTPNYRCELIDDEPVLRTGVAKHNYKMIPYSFIETGLGHLTADNDLSKRYVGVLRYIQDILVSESRDYSIADIILSKEAWPWGTIEGKGATRVTDIDQHYGTWTPMPDDVHLVPQTPQLPPQELGAHLNRTAGYISSHAAPNAIRGLGEAGVRSGTDRQQMISQAAIRYAYSNDAFKSGAAKILASAARIVKDIIPGEIRVWARTPHDEFDTVIEKGKMKEPYTCYVEFSPISEEAEYRRHDDLERLVQSGIATASWARTQMSNMNPKEMDVEVELQKLLSNPQLQQIQAQVAGGKLMQALNKVAMADQAKAGQPPAGGPVLGGQNTQQGMPGEQQPGMVPTGVQPGRPPPNIPQPGSGPALQNQLEAMRRQKALNPNQGQGGGGNR